MKRYKNKILSVLLLAFTFFVLHDYVIQNFSEGIDYGITVASEVNDKDICSVVHDNIHAMYEVNLDKHNIIYLTFLTSKPSILEASSTSYISLVPNKPPVI